MWESMNWPIHFLFWNTCEIPEDEDDEECGSVFLTAEIQGAFLYLCDWLLLKSDC